MGTILVSLRFTEIRTIPIFRSRRRAYLGI